jgi:hypothetical protein
MYPSYNTVGTNPYTITNQTVNPYSSGHGGTAAQAMTGGSVAIAAPFAEFIWMSDGDIMFEFNTFENGRNLQLTFDPEPTITVLELMRCQMLFTMAVAGGGTQANKDASIKYVRLHNLERHFKIT